MRVKPDGLKSTSLEKEVSVPLDLFEKKLGSIFSKSSVSTSEAFRLTGALETANDN